MVLVVGGCNNDNRYLNTVEALEVLVDVSLCVPDLPAAPSVLEHDERKKALQIWVEQVTKMNQDFLAKIETATSRVNKECNAKKKKKSELWYREQLAKLCEVSDDWSSQVDEKLMDAKEQIEDLERRLEGTTAKWGKRNPPSELCCPITGELMKDPVNAADGYAYERCAIERHFEITPPGQDVTLPKTG
mmetsp:Transcript_6151/g.13821  ORF Transcript_6151/g.13821 Transcript_6151/m.13821 type:complete len:189 (-) Transcript_6151:131-697(-)